MERMNVAFGVARLHFSSGFRLPYRHLQSTTLRKNHQKDYCTGTIATNAERNGRFSFCLWILCWIRPAKICQFGCHVFDKFCGNSGCEVWAAGFRSSWKPRHIIYIYIDSRSFREFSLDFSFLFRWSNLTRLFKKGLKSLPTVNGRNPEPPGMYQTLVNGGISTTNLYPDFFHQQW